MANSWPCLLSAGPLAATRRPLLRRPSLHLVRRPPASAGSAARSASRLPIHRVMPAVATLACLLVSPDSHGSGLAGSRAMSWLGSAFMRAVALAALLKGLPVALASSSSSVHATPVPPYAHIQSGAGRTRGVEAKALFSTGDIVQSRVNCATEAPLPKTALYSIAQFQLACNKPDSKSHGPSYCASSLKKQACFEAAEKSHRETKLTVTPPKKRK